MDDQGDDTEDGLYARNPTDEDLLKLCTELDARGARYIVMGGFAMRAAGLMRMTGDIDLLIDTDAENEAKVFKALEILPDRAVLEVQPGEVQKYGVVRVGDEVMVDLMAKACGVDFATAQNEVVVIEIEGIKIPFANPDLLWRTKAPTRREKDAGDLYFLRQLFADEKREPRRIG